VGGRAEGWRLEVEVGGWEEEREQTRENIFHYCRAACTCVNPHDAVPWPLGTTYATGGAKRSSPTGGLPNGIPLHSHVPFRARPRTGPDGVLTTRVSGGTSISPDRALSTARWASGLRRCGLGAEWAGPPSPSTATHSAMRRITAIALCVHLLRNSDRMRDVVTHNLSSIYCMKYLCF
jgi:hypothetical protein